MVHVNLTVNDILLLLAVTIVTAFWNILFYLLLSHLFTCFCVASWSDKYLKYCSSSPSFLLIFFSHFLHEFSHGYLLCVDRLYFHLSIFLTFSLFGKLCWVCVQSSALKQQSTLNGKLAELTRSEGTDETEEQSSRKSTGLEIMREENNY